MDLYYLISGQYIKPDTSHSFNKAFQLSYPPVTDICLGKDEAITRAVHITAIKHVIARAAIQTVSANRAEKRTLPQQM